MAKCRLFANKGAFQMEHPSLFCKINIHFLKNILLCLQGAGEMGLRKCEHFSDKEKGNPYFKNLCERLL